jgi:DNA-binding NarL/FixJ family response regulator
METIRPVTVSRHKELVLSGILVVDDHPVIARACGLVLEPIGVETIIPAYDAETGYRAFVEHAPDMSVIDLSLSKNELDGIDLIKRIRAHDTAARILVFSMRSDRGSFLAAIEAGATGYLIKDSPTDEFAKAVQQIQSGRRYIDSAAGPQSGVRDQRGAVGQGTARHRAAAGGRIGHSSIAPLTSVLTQAAMGTMASMVTPLSPDATVSVPPNASSRSRIPDRPWPNL